MIKIFSNDFLIFFSLTMFLVVHLLLVVLFAVRKLTLKVLYYFFTSLFSRLSKVKDI